MGLNPGHAVDFGNVFDGDKRIEIGQVERHRRNVDSVGDVSGLGGSIDNVKMVARNAIDCTSGNTRGITSAMMLAVTSTRRSTKSNMKIGPAPLRIHTIALSKHCL
jgi:hypothetical protein